MLPGVDLRELLEAVGYLGLFAIVFAESGLLIGFFLPGDSLLFTTGLLVATGQYLHYPLWLVCTLVVVAAVLGQIAFVRDNIEAMLVAIVLLSVIPIAIEYLRARGKNKKAQADGAS